MFLILKILLLDHSGKNIMVLGLALRTDENETNDGLMNCE